MENFQDFINSINKTIQEKLNSPLLLPFIFSWFAWNYKFVVIVFGTASLSRKVSYLDELYTTTTDRVLHWAVWPLAVSLLFVLLFPVLSIIATGSIEFWKVAKNRMLVKIFRLKIEFIPAKKAERLLAKIEELENEQASWRTKIDELTDDNNELMGSCNLLTEKAKAYEALKKEHDSLVEELEKKDSIINSLKKQVQSKKNEKEDLSDLGDKSENNGITSKSVMSSLNRPMSLMNDADIRATLGNTALQEAINKPHIRDALANTTLQEAMNNPHIRGAFGNTTLQEALNNPYLRGVFGSTALQNSMNNLNIPKLYPLGNADSSDVVNSKDSPESLKDIESQDKIIKSDLIHKPAKAGFFISNDWGSRFRLVLYLNSIKSHIASLSLLEITLVK